MKNYESTCPEQIHAWVRDYQENRDPKASHHLVMQYKNMINRLAYHYGRHNDEQRRDLVQEGAVALLKACNTYDASKGVDFSCHASVWISCAIRNYALVNRNVVKIPDHKAVRKAFYKMAKFTKDKRYLSEQRMRELSAELGISLADFKIAHAMYINTDLSANSPINTHEDGDGHSTLQCTFAHDVSPESVYSVYREAQDNESKVLSLLGKLNEKERVVIRSRVLVEDNTEAMKLRELGEELGVSSERVRQLENQAMKKMIAAASGMAA